ncbi:hypothetical protein C8D72_3391 [Kushneria indalinina DSM 14324]|uniref:Uncharacterized protein n=1 Tax=Kushneria indalinina DSM 14324 TaxID=1122140 RepID=A0A3D9DRK5_9GAMM|nr:hypothetical protein C8D72_3391 [Kushneria indalinina DSM 14324]
MEPITLLLGGLFSFCTAGLVASGIYAYNVHRRQVKRKQNQS